MNYFFLFLDDTVLSVVSLLHVVYVCGWKQAVERRACLLHKLQLARSIVYR